MTAEVFQDIPGSGIYQTATEVNNRYLVYITNVLFPVDDKAWSDYFTQRWSAEKANNTQIFNEYMNLILKQKSTIDKIQELNGITATTK